MYVFKIQKYVYIYVDRYLIVPKYIIKKTRYVKKNVFIIEKNYKMSILNNINNNIKSILNK